MTITSQPLSRPMLLLRLSVTSIAVTALGFAVVGGVMIVADLAERGEDYDGLGALIGLVALLPSLVALALSAVVLLSRRPTIAGGLGVALSVASAGLIVFVAAGFVPWVIVAVVPCVVAFVTAIATLRVRTPQAQPR